MSDHTFIPGHCRDKLGTSNSLESISVQDIFACHTTCKSNHQCAAFAFRSISHTPSTNTEHNCCLYGNAVNGDYEFGDGVKGVKCYVEPKGMQLHKIWYVLLDTMKIKQKR